MEGCARKNDMEQARMMVTVATQKGEYRDNLAAAMVGDRAKQGATKG